MLNKGLLMIGSKSNDATLTLRYRADIVGPNFKSKLMLTNEKTFEKLFEGDIISTAWTTVTIPLHIEDRIIVETSGWYDMEVSKYSGVRFETNTPSYIVFTVLESNVSIDMELILQ